MTPSSKAKPLVILLDGMARRGGLPGQTTFEASLGGAAKLLRLVAFAPAAAGREARQDRRQRARAEGAAFGDFDGCRQRLRQIGEQRGHFGAGLEAMLGRELAAVAFGKEPPLGDAQQRVMRLVVLARGEVRLVGCHKRQPAGIGQIDQSRLDDALGCHTVALQFDIEPVAEQPLQFLAARGCQRALPGRDRRVQGPGRAAAQRDEAGGFIRQPRQLDVRLLGRLGAEIGARAEPHQAAIAGLARSQEHDPRKPLPGQPRPAHPLPAQALPA